MPADVLFCRVSIRDFGKGYGILMNQQRKGRVKHVPQRTCIACRQVAGKRALIRLVRTEQGVVVDPTGKQAGRGAYLHPERACWEVVVKGNRLEQALRTKLSAGNRQELLAFAQTLPEAEAFRTPAPEQDDQERAAFADGSA